MAEILKVPFNRSYWVVPGQLLAGGYPGSEDPIEEERNLKGLIQAGIRHVWWNLKNTTARTIRLPPMLIIWKPLQKP